MEVQSDRPFIMLWSTSTQHFIGRDLLDTVPLISILV